MESIINKELKKCLSVLLRELSREIWEYKDFCNKCIERLEEEGFGIDVPLLKKSLQDRSENIFTITQTTKTREREIFCFKKISRLYETFVRYQNLLSA